MKNFNDVLESTLEYHSTLNPKIWARDKLRPEVRHALMRIAEVWRDYSRIPAEAVLDYTLSGGNANYNYTDSSDLDVHLVVRMDMIDIPARYKSDYLKDKKTLWGLTHDIKVRGYPVELYAQSSDEKIPAGQGSYSLSRGVWVQKPVRLAYNPGEDPKVDRKADHIEAMVHHAVGSMADLDTLKRVKKRLSDSRGAAISSKGEFSFDNLVFKELRNRGVLDLMNEYMKGLEDNDLGLK